VLLVLFWACIVESSPGTPTGLSWTHGLQFVFAYNSSLNVGSDSTLDGVPQLGNGPRLRVLGHVLLHRAEISEEQSAASAENEAGAFLLHVELDRFRFQRGALSPGGFDTFHRPEYDGMFSFLQVRTAFPQCVSIANLG
jgi:hypothetical protein